MLFNILGYLLGLVVILVIAFFGFLFYCVAGAFVQVLVLRRKAAKRRKEL